MKKTIALLILCFFTFCLQAEDGYDLWMRYKPVQNKMLFTSYSSLLKSITVKGNSATIQIIKNELTKASQGMLNQIPSFSDKNNGELVIGNVLQFGTPGSSTITFRTIGAEGFAIYRNNINGKQQTYVTANSDVGVLYGVFHLLRMMQTEQNITNLNIVSSPK